MASSAPQDSCVDIESYSLHVSERWLDLTKRKIELARIPREPPGFQEAQSISRGVTKTELVSLLDYWETYDHRAQEEHYNQCLPQYRTNLAFPKSNDAAEIIRVRNFHFVHRKSSFNDATPILFCHDWGASFLEIARVIEGLCEPVSTPTPDRTRERAFHVVCPSIPGFGFSDASPDPKFGLEGTADVLDSLMKKLGYKKYMLHGSRWGFLVCRALALRHPGSCIALHTAGVEAPRPALRQAPLGWLSYHLARLTSARFQWLSFGYIPSDFNSDSDDKPSTCQSLLDALSGPTQALDYALADSPTGVLALILGLIRCRGQSFEPLSIRDPWSQPEIILWTMMYWLPGPEAPLRWLRNAARESSHTAPLWRTYSPVPLGISHYRGSPPPAWAATHQRLSWIRRHAKEVGRPAWEAAEEVIIDLRAFADETIV